uniref:Uncharacterized protein n=1 Tax=Anguilla anguilla TaxID=7936 RepID=A0A0E9SMR0_ANGAN
MREDPDAILSQSVLSLVMASAESSSLVSLLLTAVIQKTAAKNRL